MKNTLITWTTSWIWKYLEDNLKENNNIFSFSRSNGFDLTKIKTFEKIYNKLNNQQGSLVPCNKLDILILNAWIWEFGLFEDINLEKSENIINLNLVANIRILKYLEKNITKNTKIIFIGSIISKKFMKNAAVYQASKFGLRWFAGWLKKEWKKVFLINPKIVDTDFHKNKINLEKRFEETSLESILETVKNIISGKEQKFEIDL